jgi:Zn-dependent protease with chaperone function
MNFFAEQDQARRKTKWLVLLFFFVILLLIGLTNIIVAVSFWIADGQMSGNQNIASTVANELGNPLSTYFSWDNFGKISLLVSGTIFCVIMFKWLSLRGGGKKLAQSMGGSRINPNTDDANEKKILNVVEEMALASGMPVPAVYLLKEELGINAFAAGNTPSDAVIGITQGAIEQFDRKQLQGVVAHEFSHILNGDMRLNLRLIAMLSGIVFIATAGELVMRAGGGGYGHRRSSGGRRGDSRILILGVALLAIGWLGTFFARVIKASISRQREFLADASAVQFTRDPQGISQALSIIGGYSNGSQVFSAKADESSHLFISNAIGKALSFATHPPLEERIKRIDPQWNGQFIYRKPIEKNADRNDQEAKDEKKRKATIAAAAVLNTATGRAGTAVVDSDFSMAVDVNEVRTDVDAIPKILTEQAKEPFGAIALMYALLVNEDAQVQEKQIAFIQQSGIAGLATQTLQFLPELAIMNNSYRLPLIELAMPALKCMSEPQYKTFKRTLLLLIRADKKFEMFEWCLFQLVRHYLATEFENIKPSKPVHKDIKAVAKSYNQVLSMLAHHGHDNDNDKMRAYSRGANTVGLYNSTLIGVDSCTLDDFIKAVNQLANCYPLLKPKLLKGLADCASHDGVITTEEKEIISSVAAVMDCPSPDLFKSID